MGFLDIWNTNNVNSVLAMRHSIRNVMSNIDANCNSTKKIGICKTRRQCEKSSSPFNFFLYSFRGEKQQSAQFSLMPQHFIGA